MIRTFIFWIRSRLYQLAYFISPLPPKSIILCYHSIGDKSWDYNVTITNFKQQIEYLLTLYQPTTLEKILDTTAPSFVLTFDDGYQSILQIKDFLKSKNIRPTLFLLSDNHNIDHQETDNHLKLLTDSDIQSLIKDSWEIGSHGSQHQDYWRLSSADTSSEIIDSKKILESKFKIPIKYFAYPKGRYTAHIVNTVKQAGYQLAVTTDDGTLDKSVNPYLLPRLIIDRTHNFIEFKRVLTITSITARKIIKKIGGRLLAKLI